MPSLKTISRALVSVSDKTGIEGFARRLSSHGIEILSTGGTAKVLTEAGLVVQEVSDFTGFPEILDGRVKTLHPLVHGGILAIRDNPAHAEQVAAHSIRPIDIVVVNLYPFERTVSAQDVKAHDAIENIDIGGPSMLRSAAKNFHDVAVVVDPADYDRVADEMDELNGTLSLATRLDLARTAFDHTARYDRAIADFLANRVTATATGGELAVAAGEELPPKLELALRRKSVLRYGENPHQTAALYVDGAPRGVAGAEQLQGKELSYNNILDLDAAWSLIGEFEDTACAIIKHTNPCGAAIGRTVLQAYQRALETDPTSAFGSIIAFNRTVDADAATALAELFVEAIVAPSYSDEAKEIFRRKKNLRVMRVSARDESQPELEVRRVSGGILVQQRDTGRVRLEDLRTVTERKPTFEEMRALLFAWSVVKHVKSNAIVYAIDGQLAGVGAGQTSRIDSARIGAEKARLPIAGSVLASDAFFPFRDGLDAAAAHGVTAVIQPGGSVRDEETIAAANEHRMAMVFTGMRHFKH
ncbi:MAG: bifunctional phosphoribosylaminoimidazolecarboxamide formyltransferase/IMP cyclohydrolase [Acidobacteria bacterium]|nr:bifunctional phosphoribosylaminoimidazolecarboxamide formyltransferase/IMP cyclohydrolase [Acidobacteriota bacterium]